MTTTIPTSTTPNPATSRLQRRTFLQGALAAGIGTAAVPTIFADSVGAAADANGPILLTVTLGGGNDGLNTLGPFESGRYRDLRGALAQRGANAHSAADGLFWHPSLRRLATRFRRGEVAVIEGVGDPLKDLSHFSNLARWQAGLVDGRISGTGWIGRWLDNAGLGQFGGVAIGGRGVPLHMRGANSSVTDLPFDGNSLYGSDRTETRDRIMYKAIRRMGAWDGGRADWVNRVGELGGFAVDTAFDVSSAYRQPFPEDRFAHSMTLAARLINLGLGTRALNVWQHGYDTHDSQIAGSATTGDHADLLSALDVGLDQFFGTLSPAVADRVVVLVYSEFGRRAEANGSRGTDHGTSNQVFVIGRRVKGGFYGDRPPIDRLDDRGNFRVTEDFRRVYATLIDNWLGGDSVDVIGKRYRTFDLFHPATRTVEGDIRSRAESIRSRRSNPRDSLRVSSPSF